MIMKRILFIVNKYYPDSNSGANIIKRICEGLAENYLIEVFVLSSKTIVYQQEEINNVLIHRTPFEERVYNNNTYRIFYERFVSCIGGVYSFNKYKFYQQIESIRNFIEKKKYDIVISVCYPIFTHYIASQILTYNMKWIAYYLDPYYCNEQEKRGKIRKLATEKKILKRSNAIIVPSLLNESYKKIYKKDIYCIDFPNIRNFDLESNDELIKLSEKHINCVFLGNLYGDIRNPNFFFRLIQKMQNDKILFYIVGDVHNYNIYDLEKWKDKLKGKVRFYNRVSVYEGNYIMKQADCLINIGNSVANQLPGKVFDYISTGKPIINISKIKDCPSCIFLQKYPIVLNIYENDKMIDKYVSDIEKFVITNKGKKIKYEIVEELFPSYTSSKVINKIENAIFEVLKNTI